MERVEQGAPEEPETKLVFMMETQFVSVHGTAGM